MWGVGPKAYEKGTFGKDWGLRSAAQNERLYRALLRKLTAEPHGPYDVLTLLIGEKNAGAFCKSARPSYMVRPPRERAEEEGTERA